MGGRGAKYHNYLQKSSKSGKIQLPKKEYGVLCSSLKTKYANQIPKKGMIDIGNNTYFYEKLKDEKIICIARGDIEQIREYVETLEDKNSEPNQ